ncbi:DUF4199 domain-containing protein [Terricaulis sp.]|uniref:DUF4199 domain-containing protein n=1 Tax=Terricaulis sp. TaxID=2768686 RepID=UPI00378494B3
MLRTIVLYGVLAGLVVAVPMFSLLVFFPHHDTATSQVTGYSLMLLALSFVFVGVKRYRDTTLGGVIKFLPALLLGLGISIVAGIVYVVSWEIVLASTHYEFMDGYVANMIEQQRAKGVGGAELEAFIAQMEQMKVMYANPLFRLPMTFIEIFPVGLIVSLITAILLRNRRFMPARPIPAA